MTIQDMWFDRLTMSGKGSSPFRVSGKGSSPLTLSLSKGADIGHGFATRDTGYFRRE